MTGRYGRYMLFIKEDMEDICCSTNSCKAAKSITHGINGMFEDDVDSGRFIMCSVITLNEVIKKNKMRNLSLIDSLRVGDAVELEGTQFLCIDYDTKDVYCVSSIGIYVLKPEKQEVSLGVSLCEHIPQDDQSDVIAIQHLPDQMSVCVAVSTGNLLLWNVTTLQVECVGSVESGIQGMRWSPDQELLVLVTGANTVITMTRDFEPLTEVPLHQTGFGEAEFITVGWGKKETQFHGSVGKQAAVVKTQSVKPVFSWDDRRPRVSWRGDGQYFVVSCIDLNTGGRVLRTWTREGVLHATGQTMDGLEQALEWRPSGSLIATSQRKPNRHDIVFFERNGLSHGEFPLNFGVSEVKVKEVSWNQDSSVLLVWCEEKPQGESVSEEWVPKSWIQLWTASNYHWYLKQSLEFRGLPEERVSAVVWDPEHEYVLHVMCGGGQYLWYRWGWTTHSTTGSDATVAVIAGDKLLMTPFKNTVVPPPMCAYSIKLPSPPLSVFFTTHDVFICSQDSTLLHYTFLQVEDKIEETSVKLEACGGNGFVKKCRTPVLKSLIRLEYETFGAHYPLQEYHFLALSGESFIFVTLSPMGNTSIISRCFLKTESKGSLYTDIQVEVTGRVLAMALCQETSDCVAVQLTDGSVMRLVLVTMTLSPWQTQSGEVVRFQQPCPQMSVSTLGNELVVIGLTERFRLFVNNLQLATNCTSYAIHEEFLLLTTHAHTCRCICRKTKLSALASLSDGKAHPFDESVRRVERGSRLVSVVANDTKVVLQMPRGNLEVIHPRALVLTEVRQLLQRVEFLQAFIVMRKHRINMNLMYDHDPESFMKNVKAFIHQIENPTHLNLFISDLQEEDVTRTMYTATYQRAEEPDLYSAGKKKRSKIDTICDSMKDMLADTDSEKYLFTILTTHVKKTTPELDVALQCVKKLRDADNQHGRSRAEEALKYLVFLVDVNELYDVALGTYDFDLVLMVAEKSQKDPKEYLPLLNDLRRLETNYQQFSIDKYLKRNRKALGHIVLCGKDHFDECVSFVKEHRLFAEALELYGHDSNQYQELAQAYGDYLSEKKYHEEAGLLYLKGGHLSESLEQYERSLSWRQCMSVATRMGYSAEKLSELGRRLAEALKEKSQHREAAVLLEEYAMDIEEAIVTLIQGQHWQDALRTMYKYKRQDFIESDLRPGLVTSYEQYQELIALQAAKYEKHRTRLIVVREVREKKRLEIMELGGERYGRTDTDLYSDTSSATGDSVISEESRSHSVYSRKSGSIYTKASGSSRKAHRKGEKKKKSLKEGSPFEDYAIVEALAVIIKHVDCLRDEISPLLRTLVEFQFESQARQLQLDYQAILSLIQATVTQIWDPIQQETADTLPSSFGPDSTANTIAQAVQQGQRLTTTEEVLDPVLRHPPVLRKDNDWKLNILTRSTDKT